MALEVPPPPPLHLHRTTILLLLTYLRQQQPPYSALEWACGTGGANCTPIQQGGPPLLRRFSDIRRTASYAFNEYCTKNGMTDDTCNFATTASLTSLDPSHSNCHHQGTDLVNSTVNMDESKDAVELIV